MTDDIVEKACSKCKEIKPLIKFNRLIRSKDGRKAMCRKCTNERYEYLTTDAYLRWTGLWRKYGITPEQFDAMVEQQNGVCAICKMPPKDKRLCVDHCHETGRVRGLLCNACNHGLGHFLDSAELMETAIEYLQSVEGEVRETKGRFGFVVPTSDRRRRGKDHPNNNGYALIGEKHGMAIFTEAQIKDFRRRYDAKEISSTDLAKEQGVPKTTMQAITSRRNWKHID